MDVLSPSKRTSGRKNFPAWIEPMQTRPGVGEKPPSGSDWLFEKKLSGVRCMVYKQGQDVQLLSPERKDLSPHFPEVASAVAQQKGSFIADGQLVAFDGGKATRKTLEKRLNTEPPVSGRLTREIPVSLHLFDILFGGDYDLRGLKLLTRKEILHTLINFEGPLRFCFFQVGNGASLLSLTAKSGWEGIVGKYVASPYEAGPSANWRIYGPAN